jgi:hypothetical protein
MMSRPVTLHGTGMMLSLIDACAEEFRHRLKAIGSDRIWFIGYRRLKNARFFIIQIEAQVIFEAGMAFVYEIDGRNDYSFFIYESYRRSGLAKKFIEKIVEMDANHRFTVSESNCKIIYFFKNKLEGMTEVLDTQRKVRIYYRP